MSDDFKVFPCNVKLPKDWGVIDLETTTQRGATRSVDGNKIYRIGWNGPTMGNPEGACIVYDPSASSLQFWIKPVKVIVGHNIKFDLEYLRRESYYLRIGAIGSEGYNFFDYLQKKAVVLDTQFITYLHSGHTKMFPSLEESCAYWGIPITKSLDLGAELDKCDYDIAKVPGLDEYLANDLEMTSLLINKMLQDEWVISNFAWILKMHEGLLGTFEIEYNGMHVDPSRLASLKISCEREIMGTCAELTTLVGDIQSKAFADVFNPSSNDHVAAAIFGGTVEIDTRVLAGTYMTGKKMGEPRYKIERSALSAYALFPIKSEWVSAKTGKISVSEDVLGLVRSHTILKDLQDFCSLMLKYRELNKLYGTYLEGLAKHLRIINEAYYVFPQINITGTATGRTSSSKPNMQNNPTHDSVGVTSLYTSRFGAEGCVLEVDFKQIEVLALAVLSGDAQLIDDIMAGRDVHEMTGRGVYGHSMNKEERRVVKTINFGLIYGAGAATLAAQSGVTEELAASLVKAFYRRYPGVKRYFDNFKATVQGLLNTSSMGIGYEGSHMQKQTIWTSATGRRYGFKDFWSDHSKSMEVSHTQTRNYPIQGLATGDLVLAALGEVWRKILPRHPNSVRLIGLVHDSLRFDIRLDVADDLVRELKCTLENAGNILNLAIKKELWDLPVKVTFSKGPNFNELEEFDV